MRQAYLSFSFLDEQKAKQIAEILQADGAISCRSILWEPPISGMIQERIAELIAECEVFVFLVSENSSHSCYVEFGLAEAARKVMMIIALDDVAPRCDIALQPHIRLDSQESCDEIKRMLQRILDDLEEAEKEIPKVFLSHDSDDFQKVDKYRELLENKGVPCWIAPRDIPPGSNYAREIPDAIEKCGTMLVFVTEESQRSENVEKEIEIAVDCRKRIIPVFLEDCELKGAFKYHLKNKQWFHAYKVTDQDVNKLICILKDEPVEKSCDCCDDTPQKTTPDSTKKSLSGTFHIADTFRIGKILSGSCSMRIVLYLATIAIVYFIGVKYTDLLTDTLMQYVQQLIQQFIG